MSHLLYSQALDLLCVYFDGEIHMSGAIGKTPLVMGKQEILLFFTREIKQRFYGEAGQMKKADVEGK